MERKPETKFEINVRIGKKITKLREANGISQERFAYENDIAKSTVARIEQGVVDARISNLERIAKGLYIELPDLFR
ncbi:helix-turn-helix XRE-family transcriptional regulators [Candidatus Termititenax aidoneus]|uniref:Helix-turn-helix XRE-family transcriptional regulators n=1 Tax=Termititenax aidoneus TaxID=2218524 RepID=A0A388TDK7_TERA1|nr:helix-turn-helix XRE-family transcriptional regulators [Candidatus Termititenax aidoneus]